MKSNWVCLPQANLFLVLIAAAALIFGDLAARDSALLPKAEAARTPSPPPPATVSESTEHWDITRHLGSKGPYHSMAGNRNNDVQGNDDDDQLYLNTYCNLSRVHMFIRHGSRYPGSGDLTTFEQLSSMARDFDGALSWMKTWEAPLTEKQVNLLSRNGARELYQLGRRTRQRYASLFAGSYSPLKYRFRNTMASRTGMSGSAFAAGMFEPAIEETCLHNPVFFYTLPRMWDYELSAKHSCPAWDLEFTQDPSSKREQTLFKQSHLHPIGLRLYASLFPNLPTHSELPISPAQLASTVFKACAFDVAAFTPASRREEALDRWCAVLRREEVEVMEYLDDLKHWWDYAYSREFNTKLACAGLSEVVESAEELLEGIVKSDSNTLQHDNNGVPRGHKKVFRHGGLELERSLQKQHTDHDQQPFAATHVDSSQQKSPYSGVLGSFGFGHSDTIVFLATALGLFKDEIPLYANATELLLNSRQFRMANFAPMAGNFAFELYSCPGTTTSSSSHSTSLPSEGTVKVRLLSNEWPLKVPACNGSAVCDWSVFESIAKKPDGGAALCDFERMCGIPEDAKRSSGANHGDAAGGDDE